MRTPNSRSCHSTCCGDGLISVEFCACELVALSGKISKASNRMGREPTIGLSDIRKVLDQAPRSEFLWTAIVNKQSAVHQDAPLMRVRNQLQARVRSAASTKSMYADRISH